MFQIVATLPFPWIIHCCTRHKFDYYVCSLFRLSLMGGKVEFSDMWPLGLHIQNNLWQAKNKQGSIRYCVWRLLWTTPLYVCIKTLLIDHKSTYSIVIFSRDAKSGECGEHARANFFAPAVLIFGLCTRTGCALVLIFGSSCANVWPKQFGQ